MRERRFNDKSGTEWRVYVVVSTPKVAPLQPPLSAQFQPTRTILAFDSEHERRRLAPAPWGWEDASLNDLEQLLARAMTVTMRLPDRR